MSQKLFVGGVDWGMTSDDLNSLFASFGSIVEAKIITDRDTGRSRGFGFVTFESADDAQKAIEELDGSSQNGRNIKVNVAEDRGRGGGGGGGGGRGGPRGGGGGGGDRGRGGPRGGGGNRW